ncbi:CdaR family protein [Mucilaginibacter segetis]|uniref:YbbR-like domain-containing protein n=1 Tax=Mucilaginibacter segetis TaxID=2793071 RepID=A0A934UNX1_9SPHI|nr:YbbR-like domain-containing protein [Mucilaginibacter segetis]MBK0380844.1 YbbR-like domain-containing protein [Mucilaginibacter segetis]
MAIIKLSAIERRRLSAFITCLVVAILAWVFTALSNPYKFTVKQIISFKNAPQKRAFHPLQSDTVNTIVQGSGWQMLFSRMNDDKKVIEVDLHTLENRNYVVLSSQLKQINFKKQINNEIIAVNPDTLFFDFSSRRVKKVPVKLITLLKYQKQFAQSAPVSIKPAFVTISGPAEILSKIDSWETDSVVLNGLNESYNARVKLRPSTEGNLEVLPKSVMVNIPVDEFTEKTLEIPVKLINNHNYYDVKIFPQKVKVTFTTSLTKYPDTNEDVFEAVADLDKWKLGGYSVLPVKLTHIPSYSKIVKVEPRNIDFIVKK